MLDVDSLARAEVVCKAWRRNIVEGSVWKHKLMALARKLSYSKRNFEDKLAMATDKEDLLKVCRPICWNLQAPRGLGPLQHCRDGQWGRAHVPAAAAGDQEDLLLRP